MGSSLLQNLVGSSLVTSVSINFVIITFLLGQFVRLEEERASPNVKKPYKQSIYTMIVVLWLGAFAIILFGVDLIIGAELFQYSVILFAIQLLLLIVTITGIAKIVING